MPYTEHDDEPRDVTVNWALSQVKISAFGISATWATLGNSSSNVGANSSSDSDEVTEAFTFGFGCNLNRRYRIHVSDGTNSWYEDFPSATSWTQDTTPFVQLDR